MKIILTHKRLPRHHMVMCRMGARLGNWNDHHSHHDSRAEASLRWGVIDNIANRMYTFGERKTKEPERIT